MESGPSPNEAVNLINLKLYQYVGSYACCVFCDEKCIYYVN